MLQWVSSGWCGTRGSQQHFTEAQLWLQLVRDGKVSLWVVQAFKRMNSFIFNLRCWRNTSIKARRRKNGVKNFDETFIEESLHKRLWNKSLVTYSSQLISWRHLLNTWIYPLQAQGCWSTGWLLLALPWPSWQPGHLAIWSKAGAGCGRTAPSDNSGSSWRPDQSRDICGRQARAWSSGLSDDPLAQKSFANRRTSTNRAS